MTKLLWENKIIVCDICKERPMKKIIQVRIGQWLGVCEKCEKKEEFNV